MPFNAPAATFTLSTQGSSIFGSNGSADVTVFETTLRSGGLRASAGGFAVQGNLNGTGVQCFIAWCLDIMSYLRPPVQYITTTTPFSTNVLTWLKISNIERLFYTGYNALNLGNSRQPAGFQLALWEVLYERPGLSI